MTIKILLILLISCSIATASTRLQRDKQLQILTQQQGSDLRATRKQLTSLNTSLIPTLQKNITNLQAHDAKVSLVAIREKIDLAKANSEVHKLKSILIFAATVATFYIISKLLFFVPIPYKWYASGGIAALIGMYILFKF